MSIESTHAIQYHLSRIARESANSAVISANEAPNSEADMRCDLSDGLYNRGTDEEIAQELRLIIETSMRVLLLMQRRTGNFSL